MPRFTTNQQRFTQGELDPSMLAREDIDQYYGALASAKNVFTLPQGGFKRRPGLEHVDRVLGGSLTKIAGGSITETAPNGGTAANASDQNDATTLTTVTGISTTNPYVVVHYDLGSAQDIGVVYLYDCSISTGTTTGEFFIQVSTDDATWVSLGDAIDLTTTAKDFSRRVHGSYRYVRFARIGATDLSTAVIALTGLDVATESATSNTRCLDFEFNVEQSYKLIVSDKNIAIYQGTTYLIDIYVEDLTSTRLPDIDWVQEADTLLIFHEDVQTVTLQRQGGNDIWAVSEVTYVAIPRFPFNGTSTSTPAGSIALSATTPGIVTVTGTTTAFDSTYVGQYINNVVNDSLGRMRVVSVESATSLTAYIVSTFDASSYATSLWQLETGYDEVWSSSLGWPRHGVFYQGRLYVDGGKSRPSVLYGSNVNDEFNFEFGEGLDSQAIGPLSGGFDEITSIYPGRSLMIFTTSAEFIIPQTFGDPITPLKAAINRQTSIGSEPGFRPQEVEGGVMYIQRRGASIQELIYDDGQQAFNSNFVSLLSSHLIVAPSDFALRKATSTEDGSYLLLVKDDGNLTIANILRSQNITSFVEATTDGSFKSCGVDIDDMYFVIERTIDGETINWLERFNNDHYMDASTLFDPTGDTDTFSGLEHLEAEECRILADGSILNNETVSGGAVTIDRNAASTMEIGLNFTPTVIDLPATYQNTNIATAVGMKTNISEITLRLSDTGNILVNGKTVSFRGFGPAGGGSPFDAAPTRFTGVKRILGVRGWSEDAQVTITQEDPLPMTVLSIKKRVNV